MKILWLVNIVMPELADHLGRTPSVFGGWLTGAMHAVRESGHDLVICTTEQRSDVLRRTVNGTVFYIVPSGTVAELKCHFQLILDAETPDVIHIFGTECHRRRILNGPLCRCKGH